MVAGLFAAGAGLASAYLGYSSSKSANKANKNAAQNAEDQYRALFKSMTRLFGEQRGLLGEIGGDIKEGFDRAESVVSGIGSEQIRGLLQRERQRFGELDQGLANRGLYNTSAARSGRRGISADTDFRIREVGEGLAGIRSDLITGSTVHQARAKEMLARSYAEEYSARFGVRQARADTYLGSTQRPISAGTFQSIGALGGSLDTLFGFGGGGGE